MFKRLNSFIQKYKLLYKYQFGFREKHSTNHSLIEITETILDALDAGYFACGIFIDFQKAFDTVNHQILIKKLEYYGIRGRANDWLSSYLTNRSQHTSHMGYTSKSEKMVHGVPQGSVLGPLLFLIYARGVWREADKCFFDVRVTHPNTPTHRVKSMEQLYRENEAEKKRAYNDRVIILHPALQTPPPRPVFFSMDLQ